MFAKKNVLAAAIMLCNDEILDEDEMFCVFSELNRKNPPFPYWNYDRIEKQMDDMSSAEIKSEFRFGHSELPLLAEALQIPQYFVCSNGTVASGMEGLRHGRSVPEISLILAEVTDHIYRTNGHLLQDLNQPWLEPQQLESFACAIHQRGAALSNCWGFVDGTVRPICRPGEHQRIMYNGHKRVHGIKFQSVVAPNGLIANLYGPVGKIS